MRNYLIILFTLLLCFIVSVEAASLHTQRIPQFNNSKVTVWKTILYPYAREKLKMHRHDHDRVVLAFDSGLIKIVSDKGKVHYLKVKKNHAYYLEKDKQGESHTDENLSKHPIHVMVIELKD